MSPTVTETDVLKALSAIIDPLLKGFEISTAKSDPSEASVFSINVLAALQLTLRQYSFTSARCETLSLVCATHVQRLVDAQVKGLFAASNLQEKLDKLSEHLANGQGKLLSTVEGMDARSLTVALRKFYGLFFDLGTFVMLHVDRILNTSIRRDCRKGVAKLVLQNYSRLYRAVADPAVGGYANVAAILVHTPEQIEVILT